MTTTCGWSPSQHWRESWSPDHFAQQVGQSAEQVHARHILVGTEELAEKLYADLQADPELFAQLAEENSIDTTTAPNGGDLGWFTRGVMVEPFDQVAFELAPEAISEPVQTEFGWHIIQVLDHQDNRALTDDQIQQTIQAETDRWLADQREEASISSVVEADADAVDPAIRAASQCADSGAGESGCRTNRLTLAPYRRHRRFRSKNARLLAFENAMLN